MGEHSSRTRLREEAVNSGILLAFLRTLALREVRDQGRQCCVQLCSFV